MCKTEAEQQQTSLGERLATASASSPYVAKDLAKARLASQMIGEGSPGSSTERYRQAAGDLANTGRYRSKDVVFASVNGNRPGRFVPLDAMGRPRGAYRFLEGATSAGATLAADARAGRLRPYNEGKRKLARYFAQNGYAELASGVWVPRENAALIGRTYRAEATQGLSPPQAVTTAHLARGIRFLRDHGGTAERKVAAAVQALGERLATSARQAGTTTAEATPRVLEHTAHKVRDAAPDIAQALRSAGASLVRGLER